MKSGVYVYVSHSLSTKFNYFLATLNILRPLLGDNQNPLFEKLNKTCLKQILRELVVTSNENHWIYILFNIVKIFQKCKIFENHWIQKFSYNADLRKQDLLSQEKISYRISSFFIILDQAWTKISILILSTISTQKKT